MRTSFRSPARLAAASLVAVTGAAAATPAVVQILPVGPRERVVLVRSRAGRVLAVGVSGHSVNLITELDAADIAPVEGAPVVEATPGKRTFLDLMRRPQGPTAR